MLFGHHFYCLNPAERTRFVYLGPSVYTLTAKTMLTGLDCDFDWPVEANQTHI